MGARFNISRRCWRHGLTPGRALNPCQTLEIRRASFIGRHGLPLAVSWSRVRSGKLKTSIWYDTVRAMGVPWSRGADWEFGRRDYPEARLVIWACQWAVVWPVEDLCGTTWDTACALNRALSRGRDKLMYIYLLCDIFEGEKGYFHIFWRLIILIHHLAVFKREKEQRFKKTTS